MSLRILMTIDAVGGVWRYGIDLAKGLTSMGHQVILAGLGPGPSPAQISEAKAVGSLEWGRAPLDWMASAPDALAPVNLWLQALVRKHRPNLIHLNLPSQAAFLDTSIPIVVVTHSCIGTWFRAMDAAKAPASFSWLNWLTREGLRQATAVAAPSGAHAALTREVHGLKEITVVPNASSAPLCLPSAGDGSAAAAARWWDRAKNGRALDAAARISRTPVTMIGACEGPNGQTFVLGAERCVGALPYKDALKRVADASLFISPSLYEPFGLAALEAARAGRPLLLSDIPVYREFWDGAAEFFDPADPSALAAAMKRLSADPAERLRLGALSRERAMAFTVEAQTQAMCALYRRASAAALVA